MSTINNLHRSIKSYVFNKIKNLETIDVVNSSKIYYTNRTKIRKIESIWLQVRICPDTFDIVYLKKLLYAYKLIYKI